MSVPGEIVTTPAATTEAPIPETTVPSVEEPEMSMSMSMSMSIPEEEVEEPEMSMPMSMSMPEEEVEEPEESGSMSVPQSMSAPSLFGKSGKSTKATKTLKDTEMAKSSKSDPKADKFHQPKASKIVKEEMSVGGGKSTKRLFSKRGVSMSA